MTEDPLDALLAHDVDEALPPDHERRIREGLASLLASPVVKPEAPPPAPPPAPAASVAAPAALGKVAIALLVASGVGVGFVAGRATAPTPSAPIVSTVPASPPSAPPSSFPAPMPSGSVAVIAPAPTPSVSARPPSPSSTATSQDAFDREQSLLERARNALVRHDAAAAAQALDEADRQFPRSRQGEERDYLRIQLLREQGDNAAARERARAFLTKYPSSLLRGRVEKLLE